MLHEVAETRRTGRSDTLWGWVDETDEAVRRDRALRAMGRPLARAAGSVGLCACLAAIVWMLAASGYVPLT